MDKGDLITDYYVRAVGGAYGMNFHKVSCFGLNVLVHSLVSTPFLMLCIFFNKIYILKIFT